MATKPTPASPSATPTGDTFRPALGASGIRLTECPECGAPAEMTHYATLASAHGPIDMVRITCPAKHWFLMTGDTLQPP